MSIADPTVRAPSAPSPATWERLLGLLGGIFLGAVLLVAAWAKLVHPAAFAEQIRVEGLDVIFHASTVAFIALGLEVFLGLSLVLGIRRLWILIPVSLLVAFFVFLTGRAWWLDAQGLRDEAASCGCFGNLLERTPAEAFWQDLLLLVPPLLLAFLGRERWAGWPWVRLAVVTLLSLGALLFAWKAPDLPLDDLATRLKPGVKVEDLCAGREETRVCMGLIVPEVNVGEHWVVLVDLEDESLAEAVPALNEYILAGEGPPLWVLSAAEPEAVTTFRWTQGPAFDIREAPPALLAGLYRTLPRSFRVVDGEVVATHSGLPPL